MNGDLNESNMMKTGASMSKKSKQPKYELPYQETNDLEEYMWDLFLFSKNLFFPLPN